MLVPVFVIFVPAAKPKTCDATWLKARSEQKSNGRGRRALMMSTAPSLTTSMIYFIAGPAGQSTCALICLAVGHCEAAVNLL